MKLIVQHLTEPCPGETENGDAVVIRSEGDVWLLAMIDGLGHGPKAAAAAHRAVEHLTSASLNIIVGRLREDVHGVLRGTRGAAATVCLLRNNELHGCAVGNVELRTDAKVPAVQSPGILGSRVRRFRSFSGQFAPGHRLIMFTDGISSRASVTETRKLGPLEACQAVMSEHRRTHDDATVMVADTESRHGQ